ncbi:MAG: VWA domain-containing protein [Planctomyces sp.]|nr:VWA domain-containing protein [Planctomyces sp.]
MSLQTVALVFTMFIAWIVIVLLSQRIRKKSVRLATQVSAVVPAWIFWTRLLRLLTVHLETAASWPCEFTALAASVASTLALSVYIHESPGARSKVYLLPAALRLSTIGLLALMLIDPVVTFSDEHEEHRQVVVLLDRSNSMKLSAGAVPGENIEPESDRQTIAESVLDHGSGGQRSLMENLCQRFDVRRYEFAESARLDNAQPNPETEEDVISNLEADDHWYASTQLQSALARVSNDVNPSQLSGVIVITDGCDHSSGEITETVQRLRKANVPVSTVLIGNQTPVQDVGVSAIQLPQQVFVGDEISVRAVIRASQLNGQQIRVQLRRDGEVLDERNVSISTHQYRDTIVFEDTPKTTGVYEYEIRIDDVQGDRIPENNVRSASVQISNDHLKLLIIDERPRWEYRYLKNLFAGRDRSVALQAVLLHPDRLEGVPDPELISASASRAFDDCEASAVPDSESEWLQFDVIVLGDISPDELTPPIQQILDRFVRLKGGSLIVIAGPRCMPHRYESSAFAELLPVSLQKQPLASKVADADSSFNLRIVNESQDHVLIQQSLNRDENSAIWNSLPRMYWRHIGSTAKPGATVLAWADSRLQNDTGKEVDRQQPELVRENPLILWHRFGAGKVLQLNFDETWRLRYGIGDTRHHRFWGQVMRWAAQDRLPFGTQFVRMGINQTSYLTGDRVRVKARLVVDTIGEAEAVSVAANLYSGETLVHSVPMSVLPDSGGLLNAELKLPEVAGKYRVELAGDTVRRVLDLENRSDARVFAEFYAEGPDPSGESADVVASSMAATLLAERTGGIVTSPETATKVLEHLGPPSSYRRDRFTVPLWNRWPVIAAFLLLSGGEWTLRKLTGLI